MLDIFFYLVLIIFGGCFVIGLLRKSVALTFFGSVVLLVLGLILMTEGVQFNTSWHITEISATQTDINSFYVTHSATTDKGAWLMAQAFLYLCGILGILTTFYFIWERYK